MTIASVEMMIDMISNVSIDPPPLEYVHGGFHFGCVISRLPRSSNKSPISWKLTGQTRFGSAPINALQAPRSSGLQAENLRQYSSRYRNLQTPARQLPARQSAAHRRSDLRVSGKSCRACCVCRQSAADEGDGARRRHSGGVHPSGSD